MTVDRRLRGPALVLGFADYAAPAQRLADRLRVPCAQVTVHRFPDGESRVTVPVPLPARVALCRSLDRPNDKLVETILAAAAARKHGAHAVTLVAPYLPYMRQDAEFTPGDAVSQRIVGALLVGPDEESAQWLAAAAAGHRFETAVCRKVRRGDRDVDVDVPPARIAGRAVVLVDDMASTGTTLAVAARRCLALGAATVDALVVHGLFVGDAVGDLRRAGVRHVWSTDSVLHATNVLPLAGLLAGALADDAPVGAAASP